MIFECTHFYSHMTGLVEFNLFCQLLPHLECSGSWLAVLLRVSGFPVGEWDFCSQGYLLTIFYDKNVWKATNNLPSWCLMFFLPPPLSFQISQKRFRPAAMLFVFTVSAVVHEYILAICFGFFYPVLFCLFMCFGSKRKDPLTPYSFDTDQSKSTKYHHSDMPTPSSSFLTFLQWCSTSFCMTKGKVPSGT